MNAGKLVAILAVIGVTALLVLRVLFWMHPQWGGPPGGGSAPTLTFTCSIQTGPNLDRTQYPQLEVTAPTGPPVSIYAATVVFENASGQELATGTVNPPSPILGGQTVTTTFEQYADRWSTGVPSGTTQCTEVSWDQG